MRESGTLLEKANEQMEEQEDEIKKLNEVDSESSFIVSLNFHAYWLINLLRRCQPKKLEIDPKSHYHEEQLFQFTCSFNVPKFSPEKGPKLKQCKHFPLNPGDVVICMRD